MGVYYNIPIKDTYSMNESKLHKIPIIRLNMHEIDVTYHRD